MTALKHNGVGVKIKSIINDVVFPISKKSLIEFARQSADGDDVIDVLNELENKMYETRQEAGAEIQEILDQKEEEEGKERHVIGDNEEIWS